MEISEKLLYAREQLEDIEYMYKRGEKDYALRVLSELTAFLVSIKEKEVAPHDDKDSY